MSRTTSSRSRRARPRRRPALPTSGRRHIRAISTWLDHRFRNWAPELRSTTPWELLVATILSAQCTDARVNQVTPALFARFPSAAAMAVANRRELESLIRPTGFYRTKGRSLIACARAIRSDDDGVVPRRMEQLTRLPGIGRKTANVVLGHAYGRPGIVVDTHVRRVSQRLGLTQSHDPVQIEAELGRMIPRQEWTKRSNQLLLHGRYVCTARRPRCRECGLQRVCPWFRAEAARSTA